MVSFICTLSIALFPFGITAVSLILRFTIDAHGAMFFDIVTLGSFLYGLVWLHERQDGVARRWHDLTAQRIKCPFCAGEVIFDAVVCKHCFKDLPRARASERTWTFPD